MVNKGDWIAIYRPLLSKLPLPSNMIRQLNLKEDLVAPLFEYGDWTIILCVPNMKADSTRVYNTCIFWQLWYLYDWYRESV